MRDIGFIGVGRMAAAMAWRFVERGWPTHLFDPSLEATNAFRGRPLVTVHDDIGALASSASVVLLSLPSPAVLAEVSEQLSAAGPARRLDTVINTSTTGPAATRRAADDLAAVGVSFVDAPVSGGMAGAREGSLTVIVSGAPDALDECAPVLEIIGAHVMHVGPQPGQAQVMKLANNVLSLGALAATAEATALTRKAGIPLEVAVEVLNASSGRNSATAVKFPRHVLTGRFDFGYPVVGALKDVELMADLADELGVPAPLARAVVDCWQLAVKRGLGKDDCTHIMTMYEELARLPSGAGEGK